MRRLRQWADGETARRLAPWLERAERFAWAALLFTLPVTSFPFFPPAMGGEALVRPLSIYALIPLLALVIVPRLLTRPAPRAAAALIPFVLVAAASSLLSLTRGIEPALGISVEARILRGMITLLVGCAYYITIAMLPRTIEDLRFSLRWIYAGGCAALAWGTLQAAAILFDSQRLYSLLAYAQTFISIRPLHPDRVAGLTYEPHWFAEQIILLILPWTLAAILNDYTVYRRRWRRVTGEWLVLGWALMVLPFTFSRSGLLDLAVVVFLGVIFFRPQPQAAVEEHTRHRRRLLSFARRRLLEAGLAVLLVLGPIYLVGSSNVFFARVWGYWRQPNATLSGYLSYLGFDARLVYAQAAYNAYLRYPLLGVGLGNYAFYFEEMLPNRPLSEVPEVLFMITPEPGRDRLITSKNFYLRLLGETGIVGAVAYLAFFIANLGGALYLWLGRSRESRYWGTASLCGLLAFSMSALTFDSFVIPNTWLVFGLITAATRVIMHCSLPGKPTASASAPLAAAPLDRRAPEVGSNGDL